MSRITNNILINNVQKFLQNNMKDLDDINQKLSSGKQFQKPSEAPIQTARSLQFDSFIESNDQYQSNIDSARNWISTTESSLSDAGKILQRVRELSLQGVNGPLSQNERDYILQEVKQLKEELINVGNTKLGNRYLFSGEATSTQPFSEEGTSWDYAGDEASIAREISAGTTMNINITGNGVFDQALEYITDLENNLEQVAGIKSNAVDPEQQLSGKLVLEANGNDALEFDFTDSTIEDIKTEINNEPGLNVAASISHDNRLILNSGIAGEDSEINITDATEGDIKDILGWDETVQDKGIEGTADISNEDLSKLDQALNSVINKRAEMGAKINRLDMRKNRMEEENVNLKELRSENEDVDLAEVITELKMEESVYRASLAAGSRSMQPSLVDFLQ